MTEELIADFLEKQIHDLIKFTEKLFKNNDEKQIQFLTEYTCNYVSNILHFFTDHEVKSAYASNSLVFISELSQHLKNFSHDDCEECNKKKALIHAK